MLSNVKKTDRSRAIWTRTAKLKRACRRKILFETNRNRRNTRPKLAYGRGVRTTAREHDGQKGFEENVRCDYGQAGRVCDNYDLVLRVESKTDD